MTKVFAVLNRYAKFIPPALAVVVYILNNVYVSGSAHSWVTVVTGIAAALGVAGLTNTPTVAHLSLVARLEAVESIIAPFLKPKVVALPVSTTSAKVTVAGNELAGTQVGTAAVVAPEPSGDALADLGTALTGVGA